jgi:putative transposase
MRKNRILAAGAIYHVTTCINRKELLLSPKEEKKHLLAAIARAKAKYPFILEAFCIMNNHIHMLIRPLEKSSLSRIMQWIKSVYAISWNKRHGQSGHVWGERFYSRIISGFNDLVNVINYIDNNPVKAGLVSNPIKWEESGLCYRILGHKGLVDRAPDWLLLAIQRYTPLLLTI